MKNINDLTTELAQVFQDLKDEKLTPKIASEMNNAAGKLINSIKIQLEYSHLRQEKPDITFMKS